MLLKGAAVAVALLLVGNLAILAASLWARGTTAAAAAPAPAPIQGIDHLRAVDDRLWRGGAPTTEGYRGLASAGISTVVDLRAEDGIEGDARVVRDLGMELVHIPVRDGQIPSTEEIDAFLAATGQAEGGVFVHCGAGVGRTGAMVGAYQVAKSGLSGSTALRRNLSVGPPSLEQIVFVAGMGADELGRPGPLVTALSRVLDAPRRIWSRIG